MIEFKAPLTPFSSFGFSEDDDEEDDLLALLAESSVLAGVFFELCVTGLEAATVD